jgi:hypothetical protein
MGDKKTFTDEEFRRLKKQLRSYISRSEWDEKMNIKRERWLWERGSKLSKNKNRTYYGGTYHEENIGNFTECGHDDRHADRLYPSGYGRENEQGRHRLHYHHPGH